MEGVEVLKLMPDITSTELSDEDRCSEVAMAMDGWDARGFLIVMGWG